MKLLLLVLTLTAGLSEALICSSCNDRDGRNCTLPVEKECKDACSLLLSDGKQFRGCGDDGTLPFVELGDHDKKCKTWTDPEYGLVQVCFCNYDRCNENMADHSNNKDIMTGLGKALKCSICDDFSDDIGAQGPRSRPKCTVPVEKECEDACFSALKDGKQQRVCELGVLGTTVLAFAELGDHDKKCKTYTHKNESIQACLCNYDRCNENMANPTSLASLALLASLMLALTI